MSLLNPALIWGLGLVAVPVVLHLLMRARPKRMVFPALRLIRQRRMQNTRRIRLRHLWLLLLRMAAVAGLVMALVRPTLPAANYGLSGREALTLLGILTVAGGVYFGLLSQWRRRGVARHALLSRRTSLRGGLGAAMALLILLLVAWPWQRRIAAEVTAPLPEVAPDVPVAAVFLFDTSQSMALRQDSETRLDVAKRFAREHLSTLPPRSRVAIGDCSSVAPVLFQADLTGAENRIESLAPTALSLPLNDRLRAALALQEDDRKRTFDSQETIAETSRTDRMIREVYILTDLTQSAWQVSSAKQLREELERLSWLGVYVIDTGLEEPRNIALTGLSLSRQTVSADEEVVVEATVSSTGYEGQEVRVEFFTDGKDGQPVKQGQTTIRLDDGAARKVQFATRATTDRMTRGEVRLVAGDPLPLDDALWFTVGTRRPVRALVSAVATDASAQGILASDANELVELLRVLHCDVLFQPAHELEAAPLDQVDLVFLINVPAPSVRVWKKLDAFVSAGGGLAAFLGTAEFAASSGVRSPAWNTPEAQALLPGELVAPLRFDNASGLDVRDTNHPLLKKFEQQGLAAEMTTIPIFRYWKVEPAADASVILRYSGADAPPAVLERSRGDGRVILLTTAGNLALEESRQWSRLAAELPFLMLMDQMVLYLSRQTDVVLNFEAGAEVVLPVDRHIPLAQYLLRRPGGAQLRGDVPTDGRVQIRDAGEVGQYTLRSPNPEVVWGSGFSVNPVASESRFNRLTEADLDNLLGQGRYSLAQNLESLTRSVTTGRLGVEVFPVILVLAILAFCLEHLVANRFYDVDQAPASDSAALKPAVKPAPEPA